MAGDFVGNVDLGFLSAPNMASFLTVLVGLAGLYILVCQVVESTRKLTKNRKQQENSFDSRVSECDRRFKADLSAIRDLEKRTTALEEGQRVQCAGVHALLEHELHNGNAEEMKDASKELFDYLNKK